MLLKLSEDNYDEALNAAVLLFERGGIVAYPTETFYALGAKYDNSAALERLHLLKQGRGDKAMPLIIGDAAQLAGVVASTGDTAKGLIERFWPGPLTLVLKAVDGLDRHIVSEGKVAVRVPGDSFALKLARAAGFPITATSANPSGMPPAETAAEVIGYFGDRVDSIIDCGRTKGGQPSTIADATGEEVIILRRGAIEI